MKKIEKSTPQLRKLQLKFKTMRILASADLQQIKGGLEAQSAACDSAGCEWDK